MSQIISNIKIEFKYFFDYLFSIFSLKYRNELLCILFGLPFLYIHDHPLLMNKILNHIP